MLTEDKLQILRMLELRHLLGLEIRGHNDTGRLAYPGRTAYAMIREEFPQYKGSRETVYNLITATLKAMGAIK